MNNGNSPLEMLAAFAIVFTAGAASLAALAAYKQHLQKTYTSQQASTQRGA